MVTPCHFNDSGSGAAQADHFVRTVKAAGYDGKRPGSSRRWPIRRRSAPPLPGRGELHPGRDLRPGHDHCSSDKSLGVLLDG